MRARHLAFIISTGLSACSSASGTFCEIETVSAGGRVLWDTSQLSKYPPIIQGLPTCIDHWPDGRVHVTRRTGVDSLVGEFGTLKGERIVFDPGMGEGSQVSAVGVSGGAFRAIFKGRRCGARCDAQPLEEFMADYACRQGRISPADAHLCITCCYSEKPPQEGTTWWR